MQAARGDPPHPTRESATFESAGLPVEKRRPAGCQYRRHLEPLRPQPNTAPPSAPDTLRPMRAPLWQHRVDRVGDLSTITLSGELNLSAERDVQEALTDECRQRGLISLSVDMSAATFIDSTVLSTPTTPLTTPANGSPSHPAGRYDGFWRSPDYRTCSSRRVNSPSPIPARSATRRPAVGTADPDAGAGRSRRAARERPSSP